MDYQGIGHLNPTLFCHDEMLICLSFPRHLSEVGTGGFYVVDSYGDEREAGGVEEDVERSYRLFSHLTCRWESATMKALMSMNMKHAN